MTNFENAKVQVAQGWLQGYTEGKLKIFKGIPYAASAGSGPLARCAKGHRVFGCVYPACHGES